MKEKSYMVAVSRNDETIKDIKGIMTRLSNNAETFADDVVYSECYGPEYHGISQILQWFEDWNVDNTVLEWTIKRFLHQENITVAEWYFKCRCGDVEEGFDGVSLVEFDDSNKIVALKEFQSKAEHCYPYGK